MALGNYDNNKEMPKRPTVYSAYSFANPVSTVDPTRLTASFWSKMLKLTITPRVITNGSDDIVWDKEQHISIHLTHIKAYMFAKEIRKFITNPSEYNSDGVISNETMITISNGDEFGANGVFIVIRKIKPDTMETISSYTYEINSQYHYAVNSYNELELSYNKNFKDYELLELEQLLILLDSYVAAINNAIAYTVVDALDYKLNRIDSTNEAIAKNLGIEVRKSGGYSANSTRRIASKSNNSSFSADTRSLSLDEAEDLLK